jgi:hypothetical protein
MGASKPSGKLCLGGFGGHQSALHLLAHYRAVWRPWLLLVIGVANGGVDELERSGCSSTRRSAADRVVRTITTSPRRWQRRMKDMQSPVLEMPTACQLWGSTRQHSGRRRTRRTKCSSVCCTSRRGEGPHWRPSSSPEGGASRQATCRFLANRRESLTRSRQQQAGEQEGLKWRDKPAVARRCKRTSKLSSSSRLGQPRQESVTVTLRYGSTFLPSFAQSSCPAPRVFFPSVRFTAINFF